MSPGSSSSEQNLDPVQQILQQESRELYPPIAPSSDTDDDNMSSSAAAAPAGSSSTPAEDKLTTLFIDLIGDTKQQSKAIKLDKIRQLEGQTNYNVWAASMKIIFKGMKCYEIVVD